MSAAIKLRKDYTGKALRQLARASRDGPQIRRLLALACICDGGSRTEAAKTGSVTLQIVRDWVLRFNEEGPDGLVDRKAPGAARALSPSQSAALAQVVLDGPNLELHGVVRWRLVDLVQWVSDKFGVSLGPDTISRELKRMNYAKLTARPQHPGQDEEALDAFKKTSPLSLGISVPDCRKEPA